VAILRVNVRLQSPLLAGDPFPGPYGERSVPYLPGAVLRGALGARLVEECGHSEHNGTEGCDYAKIFGPWPPPRFSPCYPATEGIPAPFPATARTCKNYPGLTDLEDPKHGVWDCLFSTYLIEQRIKLGKPIQNPACSICSADLEPIQGFYEHGLDGKRYRRRAWIRRVSRTAIDRARGTAADEMLYTLEFISERMATGRRGTDGHEVLRDTQLVGVVTTDEARASLLARRLGEIRRLGGDTGSGLGVVTVQVRPLRTPQSVLADESITALSVAAKDGNGTEALEGSGLIQRLALFNHAFRASHGADDLWPAGSLFFTIDLLSETIWFDRGLASDVLPLDLYGASLVRSFSSARVMSGWNNASGTMRAPRRAIAAGSVFLYRFDKAADCAKLRALLEGLSSLQSEGWGDDRERGFGYLDICSKFHMETGPL